LVLLLSAPLGAQTQFEDVTTSAGIVYSGESWGASVGDLNGDGWPDLFVNHHRAAPSLHVNQGNSSFLDITSTTYWNNPLAVGDMHGGSWADFDNDGDQDFYVTHGSKNANHFMVNVDGELIYSTPQYDPLISSWRARLPIWFDFTHDGLLDVLVTSENTAPLSEQAPGSFINRTAAAGIDCSKRQMAYLVDVTGDGALDLICTGATFPGKIYDFRLGVPFTQVNGIMPNTGATQDVAVADFDGNLSSDFFLVRGAKRVSGADQVDNNNVAAQMITIGGGQKSAKFVSNGDLTITLVVERAFSGADVSIGASGWNPNVPVTKVGGERTMILNLSSGDPSVVGIAPHNPRSNRDVFIGYDPATQTWTIINSPGGLWTYLTVMVTSTSSVSSVSATGLNNNDRPIRPVLMSNKAGGFADVTAASGLSAEILCVSTAAADFDNDMDVDIYAVCRGANFNVANIYFDNDGFGNFTKVPFAGGAAGPVGPGVGKGESVVLSDFDIDGNIDLYVTNGLALNPERVGGPDLLYRNLGHATNQWIQFDLVGSLSNRDGIGARVLVTAAGTTQLREQGGGYHRWSQNDKRLHFGLGPNALVDVTVEWPSGVVDVHSAVAAGSVYRLFEGGAVVKYISGQTSTPVVSIAPLSANYVEAGGSAALSINLSAVSAAPVTVDYTTVDDTAFAPGDYESATNFVTFAPGEMSKPISIDIVDDAVLEHSETFTVELLGVTGDAILGQSVAAISIDDDDGVFPEITIVDAAIDEDAGEINFTVMLTATAVGNVDFTVSTADGTATVVDGDYSALTNMPGAILETELSTTVTVNIGTDTKFEGDESFTVLLSLVSDNAVISDGTATGTIINDDSSGGPAEVPVTMWLGHQGGVTTPGNQITYDGSGLSGWNNQAYSVPISDFGFIDGYEVRFEVLNDPLNTNWVAGLGIDELGPSRTDIDFGFRSANGNLQIRQNGNWLNSVGPLASGDILSIYVNGGAVEYRLNGAVVFSSTYVGSPAFYVDSAFKGGGGAIALAVTVLGDSGGPPPPPPGDIAIVDWLNAAGGVSAVGDDLSFSGTPSFWISTINSVPLSSLGAGSSYTVSWTVNSNPVGSNWVVGLGVTESGPGRTDIDHGLRNANGALQVRENGIWRLGAGALSIDDTLSLRVNGTTLDYQLNGVTLYSTTISGSDDFYVDTAFKNGPTSLADFTLTQQ